jgi:hypothetical protein
MKIKVLLIVLLTGGVVFAGSAAASLYQYGCDVLPTKDRWFLHTGTQDDMEVVEDPGNPGNYLLHITSKDQPKRWWNPWSWSLRQFRMDYDWSAKTDTGTTFEIRFKQTKGGLFAEPYDGSYTISFETKAMDGSGTDQAWLYNVGGSSGNVLGPRGDFTDWQVIRGTAVHNGDGTCDVRYYLNGEEVLFLENEKLHEDLKRNSFRIGHSQGTGPAKGRADIWIDYINLCTDGALSPTERDFGEPTEEGAEIDRVTEEITKHAAIAQQYYAKPVAVGGGGMAFTGFSLPVDSTENATYAIEVTAESVTITGTCLTAKKEDGTPVTIVTTVFPQSLTTTVNE